MTLIIRSNLGLASPILIRDMGIIIPAAGGSETFTDEDNINDARRSSDLRSLASDGAFPGPPDSDSNTLILNDGTSDIAPGDIDAFFGISVMIGATTAIGGAQGLVPQPFAGDDGKFLRGNATWVPAPELIYASFAFNTVSPLDFGALAVGDMVIEASVVVETAFDDPSALLTLGLTSSPGGILQSTEIDPTVVGTYYSGEAHPVVGSDGLRLTVAPGVSTQGAGRITVAIRRA